VKDVERKAQNQDIVNLGMSSILNTIFFQIFFSKQFAKKHIQHPHDYLFTALCANTILSSKNPSLMPEAILFPSVAYKYRGFNTVFKTQLVDNNELVLINAHHYRLLFEQPDKYPKINKIKEAKRIDGDSIVW